jgi:amino acid transporter
VNNLFYFPSLLLFGAANAVAIAGDRWAGLADNRAYSIAFVLGGIWLTVVINIVGLKSGKWVQNIGTTGVWIPAALLIAAGVIALATTGSATSFAPHRFVQVPGEGLLGTLALWSAMCFAFSGFEITSYVGQEVTDPERTLPRGVLIAGAAIAAMYILGSTALLIALSPGALHDRSGITDAVDLVASRMGLPALGWLTGGLLAVAAFAGTFSWMAGSARVPFAAGVDRAMPAWLGRLHPHYRTPHIALVVQGALSSAIFIASVFLTFSGGRSSIRDAYEVLVNLTILVYFIPYFYLFLAVPRLISGISMWVRLAVATGASATLASMVFLFVPPPGTQHVLSYEMNILVQSAAVLLSGLLFYRRSTRDA